MAANTKLDKFKKSLDLTQRVVEIDGRLDLTIDQLIELLYITGVLPEDAEDLEVYYGDTTHSAPMEDHLTFRWGL